ncbi:MAG: hypothetical protein IJL26_13775 [Clostridia bacterium]|nr:hypothetical protein [Clostridia bacterium]
MKRIGMIFMICMLLFAFPTAGAAEDAAAERTTTAEQTAAQAEEPETAVNAATPAEPETVIVYVTVPTEPEPEAAPETTADRSAPRLMTTAYALDKDFLSPGESAKLTVTITNTNKKRAAANLKLTLTDESGDIEIGGMNTRFVGALGAGKSYNLEFPLTARHSAAVGRHSLTLTAEYEDGDFQSYSSADTLYVDVRQPAELSFSGAELPERIVEGDTVTVTVELMNTGKARLSNCRADFEIPGLVGGGTAFGGDLAPGEGKTVSANLRAQPEQLGVTKGTISVTYEDEYGKIYTKTADVSTEIEKKVEIDAAPSEEKKKTLPWWLYGSAGIILGGGAAFGVTYGVCAAKQRRQDELRL